MLCKYVSLCKYVFSIPFLNCLDEFNHNIPKLEKSVSGSSPSRDRLLLTIVMLLLGALLIS